MELHYFQRNGLKTDFQRNGTLCLAYNLPGSTRKSPKAPLNNSRASNVQCILDFRLNFIDFGVEVVFVRQCQSCCLNVEVEAFLRGFVSCDRPHLFKQTLHLELVAHRDQRVHQSGGTLFLVVLYPQG